MPLSSTAVHGCILWELKCCRAGRHNSWTLAPSSNVLLHLTCTQAHLHTVTHIYCRSSPLEFPESSSNIPLQQRWRVSRVTQTGDSTANIRPDRMFMNFALKCGRIRACWNVLKTYADIPVCDVLGAGHRDGICRNVTKLHVFWIHSPWKNTSFWESLLHPNIHLRYIHAYLE
jgi:hypothetical protein